MRAYKKYILGGILLLAATALTMAQDVRIEIPISNINNKTDFSVTRTVFNTGSNTRWIDKQETPNMWCLNSRFLQENASGASLPTSVLQWQLDNIGGQQPTYHVHDIQPGYKSFSTSPQSWYEPYSNGSKYSSGNVVFKFKIPAAAFENNIFQPGEYKLTINHNYENYFTPNSFNIILVVPYTQPIQWLSNMPTKTHEITSLNQFRSGGTRTFDAIGAAEISNTINFNLWAQTASSSIKYTSSNGVEATREVSLLKLGSTYPKVITAPLSANWKNHTPNNPFLVVAGRKHNFDLQFSISESDFRNHFFNAGIYNFQINLDAKSTTSNDSDIHKTDVSIKVLPLSEITIPMPGNEVSLEFNTATDYQHGKSRIISNQIQLSNNETYELYVKSEFPYFNKSGIQSDVPSRILQIGVDGDVHKVTLSQTSQLIISNGTPVLDKNLNMMYTISASAAQTLLSKEKATYSINVIYSFTAL
ncbi:MAG: hypothetical protein ACOH2D_15225 [Gelidibacter sp.]|uniref:hypothetical protein n=1 Tax=Gelidibacter sp. TaxID=2018083 RepID=UPI003264525A